MKANELMIGDWVSYHGIVNKIAPADFCHFEWIDEIRPISLTPEILEKNGFVKVLDEDGIECYRYYNRAGDGYIKISLYNGGDGDWGIKIVNYEKFDDNEIVYNNNFMFLTVHKLQHTLRLCGIEKEIEL